MAEKRYARPTTFTKGLDKASGPFEADPARALDELNYVYRDGKVQKRFGANQLLSVTGTLYRAVGFDGTAGAYKTNNGHFNGLWRFKAEDGANHLIAHVGKLLYEIDEATWEATPFTVGPDVAHEGRTYRQCHEFEDYKSCAVIGNNALYFLGGNKLMKLRFPSAGTSSLAPVAESAGTYVPTTTASITYKNAYASGRTELDLANLMTQWRKNLLLSGVGVDSGKAIKEADVGYVYQLDAPIVGKSAGDVSSARIKITRRL